MSQFPVSFLERYTPGELVCFKRVISRGKNAKSTVYEKHYGIVLWSVRDDSMVAFIDGKECMFYNDHSTIHSWIFKVGSEDF